MSTDAASRHRPIALAGLTALLLTLSGLAASGATAAETVSLYGQVVNGTSGGAVPTGDQVVVAALRGQEVVEQRSTTVGTDGNFTVADLPAGADLTYAARVAHGGVAYFSDVLTPRPGAVLQPIAIQVYETTADRGAIAVERHSLLVLRPDPAERTLNVLELVVLRNDGDRTWVPRLDGPEGPMGLLRFSLPDGASDLRPGTGLFGDQTFVTDVGFASNTPVLPGRQQISFTYRIAYGASRYVLDKTLPYATEQVQIEVPAELVDSVVGLDDLGTGSLAGRPVRRFGRRDLPARTALAIHFAGLPGAPLALFEPAIRWSALGLAVAAALGAGTLGLIGRRRDSEQRVGSDALSLPRQLALLDLARERGELTAGAFDAARRALLERALADELPGPRPDSGTAAPTT